MKHAHEARRVPARISERVAAAAAGNFNLLDLHGLHVDEALERVRATIERVQDFLPGKMQLRCITGKGNGSDPEGPRCRRE
jgi:hypothetical protein